MRLLYSYHLAVRVDYVRVSNEMQVCIVPQFTGVSIEEIKISGRLH